MTQGYSIIADKLEKACKSSYDDFERASIEYGKTPAAYCIFALLILAPGCFARLKNSETVAIARRLESAKSELEKAETAERNLQARYSSLKSELSSA